MTEQIVVGIDGSPESFAAAQWAGREAQLRAAPVRLLNVWQNPASNVQFSPDPEGLRLWYDARLNEAAKEVTERFPQVAVAHAQVAGTPARTLLDASADALMTVVGTHGLGGLGGLGGFGGFVYGSVALRVLARSDRPVVAVRAPREDGAPGETDGGVVLGIDLTHPSEDLIAFAFEEATVRHVPLRVAHVWNEQWLYGYAGPPVDPRLARELRAETAGELATLLTPWHTRFPAVDLSTDVLSGPVSEQLVQAAQDAALLVVGRRRRRSSVGAHLGAVAHGTLHHARCPVAVVPHD